MYIIKVTNFAGDALYVCSVAKSCKVGFRVKIREKAKKFSREQAELLIKTFKPWDGTTFSIESA
jgi:hypothetical protein